MRDARAASRPNRLLEGDWHLPYVHNLDGSTPKEDLDAACEFDKKTGEQWIKILRKVSVGRCAAVSYERQEVKNFEKDVARYSSLRGSGHMSPFEHPARPMTLKELDLFQQPVVIWDEEYQMWRRTGDFTHFLGNVQGWVQERKMILNEHDFSKIVKE